MTMSAVVTRLTLGLPLCVVALSGELHVLEVERLGDRLGVCADPLGR